MVKNGEVPLLYSNTTFIINSLALFSFDHQDIHSLNWQNFEQSLG